MSAGIPDFRSPGTEHTTGRIIRKPRTAESPIPGGGIRDGVVQAKPNTLTSTRCIECRIPFDAEKIETAAVLNEKLEVPRRTLLFWVTSSQEDRNKCNEGSTNLRGEELEDIKIRKGLDWGLTRD
ncbi:hypothetical protein K503DRAFT_786719 [Rhizopogon vinicolor AM-OR11-026]|uniref:Uncharacterized protein n=1 Tax=Rhizopogon vinicolor AM-OR11-026 TaxID=1314800 RepID=A0A1B7MKK7_9AGAM|nr:hypothetical protein K503DRAFT_786719 [Rhizopogon vinicolor AM-OR11-026]